MDEERDRVVDVFFAATTLLLDDDDVVVGLLPALVVAGAAGFIAVRAHMCDDGIFLSLTPNPCHAPGCV